MINPHKIDVLYPGIDFSRLGNSGDSLPNHALGWLASHPGPVIAHGAILRGEKGHSVILKALVEVKKKIPNDSLLDGRRRPRTGISRKRN